MSSAIYPPAVREGFGSINFALECGSRWSADGADPDVQVRLRDETQIYTIVFIDRAHRPWGRGGTGVKTNIEIAQEAKCKPIRQDSG